MNCEDAVTSKPFHEGFSSPWLTTDLPGTQLLPSVSQGSTFVLWATFVVLR